MILHEFLLCLHHDLGLFRPIVTERVRLFVGKEMHELELHTEVIEPFMDVLGEFDSKRLVESRDIAHDMRLGEYVVVPEQGFIGGTIERNHVTEHAAMLRLEVAQLPIDTF